MKHVQDFSQSQKQRLEGDNDEPQVSQISQAKKLNSLFG